jgi:hypothetical protein
MRWPAPGATLMTRSTRTSICQPAVAYPDPGDDVLVWERLNGTAHLEVLAGKAMHPVLGRLVQLGLPFGPKPRLVLVHVNAEAMRTNSPEVEIEDSLTAFVKRLKLDPGGRNMRTIKDQLARLSAASVRLGMIRDGRAVTVNSHIVSAFDLWFPKDHRQRINGLHYHDWVALGLTGRAQVRVTGEVRRERRAVSPIPSTIGICRVMARIVASSSWPTMAPISAMPTVCGQSTITCDASRSPFCSLGATSILRLALTRRSVVIGKTVA